MAQGSRRWKQSLEGQERGAALLQKRNFLAVGAGKNDASTLASQASYELDETLPFLVSIYPNSVAILAEGLL